MIPRKIAAEFIQAIKNKGELNNILLVEGARQVGKTTVVRQVLKQLGIAFREFNLEEERSLAEKIDLCGNFEEFTELVRVEMKFEPGGLEILFIDEAQESRRLGGFIRFMKEKWKNTQVILSGSILSRIFRDDVRYPVGRVTPIHVQPFSFEEFLVAAGEKALLDLLRSFPKETKGISQNSHSRLLELLESYFAVGGLPEVVTHYFAKKDWRKLRENLLLGYYNDFKRVLGEEKQAYFVACMKTVANLLGFPFKNSSVASLIDGGKNREIIKSLSRLEAWKMIFKVEQRGPNIESSFHPKRYLFDLGIARQLRETATPAARLLEGKDNTIGRITLGGLVENVVSQVLIHHSHELSGWKKASSGSEVDFVMPWRESVIPIECKATMKVKNTHLSGIRDFMKRHRVTKGMLVALAPFEIRKFSSEEEIIILPLYLMEHWQELVL